MVWKTAIATALLALTIGAPAIAGTVLFDDFSQENGGATLLDDTSLANFYSVHGSVDLIGFDNSSGLIGTFPFVELGPGSSDIFSRVSFGFQAGDLVTLSFLASGNQRQPTDPATTAGFGAGFQFDHQVSYTNVSFGGGFPTGSSTGVGSSTGFDAPLVGGVPWNSPWQPYYVSFTALESGSLKIFLVNGVAGAPGPALDDIDLTIGSVGPIPEPSTWAMMLAGLIGAGAALRLGRCSVTG